MRLKQTISNQLVQWIIWECWMLKMLCAESINTDPVWSTPSHHQERQADSKNSKDTAGGSVRGWACCNKRKQNETRFRSSAGRIDHKRIKGSIYCWDSYICRDFSQWCLRGGAWAQAKHPSIQIHWARPGTTIVRFSKRCPLLSLAQEPIWTPPSEQWFHLDR